MTERKIKVLTVSDVHSVATLLDDLQRAVERHKPDILACIGDIMDFEATGRGMLSPPECGKRIANMRVAQTVFVRGNHEHNNWHDFAEQWRGKQQKLVRLHGEAFVYGPLVIGFPCLLGDEDAFRGDRPVLEIEPDTWLRPLLKRFGSAIRTLWMMHEPPLGTPLAPEFGVIAGGTGGASVEWFTVNGDGSRALVGGTQPGALKAYRTRMVNEPQFDTNAPTFTISAPAPMHGAVPISREAGIPINTDTNEALVVTIQLPVKWGKNTLYLWQNQDTYAPLIDAWEIANRNNIFTPVGLKNLRFIANSDFHKPKHIYSWKTLLHCEKDPDAIKEASF